MNRLGLLMVFTNRLKLLFFDTLPLTLSMLVPVVIILLSGYIKNNVIVYYGIGILFAYFVGLFSMVLRMQGGELYFGPATNDLFSILLFIGWSILIIIMFGVGWDGFTPEVHNFALAANVVGIYDENYKIERMDSFYFSIVTFTSVGFGDFIPVGFAGKLFACEEAFIGHAHTAVFFAIVVGKIVNKKIDNEKTIGGRLRFLKDSRQK